jgi:3-mercaptopyruvate sulfurtransferase SseA
MMAFAHTSEALEMADTDWQAMVKGILKAEMKRRNVTYEQLAKRLGEVGVRENAQNLRTKVSRGGFSAVFFVQCLRAIGCREVRLTDA